MIDSLHLRRILHSLGAIACGLIGAGIGWAFAAGPRARGRLVIADTPNHLAVTLASPLRR